MPERRKMPVRVSSERMAAAALRVLNSASVIRLQSLHLLIRQPGRIMNCNRVVEIDCAPGFTVASIQNGVIARRAAGGPTPDLGDDSSRLDSSAAASAAVPDRLKRRA